MNHISMIILLLTAIPIGLGVLLGLFRGARRSILQFCLVLACIAVSFIFCGTVTDKLLALNVGEGGTLLQTVISMLPENMQSLGDQLVPLATILVKTAVFIAMLIVSLLLCWAIIYPICTIFVRKKKKGVSIVGLLLGGVQGILVAVCLCVMVSGLAVQVNRLSVVTELDFSQTTEATAALADEAPDESTADSGSADQDGVVNIMGDFDLWKESKEYVESGWCKLYSGEKAGGKIFGMVATVKINDKVYTIDGQIEALVGMINMAKEFNGLNDLLRDFQSGNLQDALTEENLQKILDIFNNLSDINGGLSEEAKETVNGVLKELGKTLLSDTQFSDVDLSSIDFQKEGEMISALYEFSKDKADNTELTAEEATELVDKMADSDLLLTALDKSGASFGDELDDSEKNVLSDAIENVEDEAKRDMMRNLFGLN